MQVSVIVPTYNEKENIESLTTQLLALPTSVRIIVVDDNSPDGTGEIADRLAMENAGRVSVIHRPGKLGLGTAYIAGFKEALAEGADLVCSMDADFSHNPRCVPDIVDEINHGVRSRHRLALRARWGVHADSGSQGGQLEREYDHARATGASRPRHDGKFSLLSPPGIREPGSR